jgi:trimethylamine--corrinoid protein Co-methyltransferase
MTGRYEPLAPDVVLSIVGEAKEALATLGIAVHDDETLDRLADRGARIEREARRAFLPPSVVDAALSPAPATVQLFDVSGAMTHEIGGDRQYFAPGSSATLVLDADTQTARPPTTRDYVRYVHVVESLSLMAAQSTAFIPADVPADISDSYRLYLSLARGRKPVVTGTFTASGFAVMHDLQVVVRGTEDQLRQKPLTIFTCCPTSPLAWSEESVRTLTACARQGIPVEIVPMPLAGFLAPVRLAGTLVQHTAEALSGVVIAQTTNPGTPVLFGCAATLFDVRDETTPMAAVESMLLACGSAQIGRALRLPTQGYVALSDAKVVDAQAGLETGSGAMVAALAGINQVAGPGMLEFGNCFSIEKLVIDHEGCAIASRLRQGIDPVGEPSLPVIAELLRDRHLLIADDTRRHGRRHLSTPGATIDRAARPRWVEAGSPTAIVNAAREVTRILSRAREPVVDDAVARALHERMLYAAKKSGLGTLPTCET